MLALVSMLVLAAVALATADMNQGGIPYTISNPKSSSGTYSTAFTGEYFDVYGEVQTRYSQVYWKRNDPVPLPEEVVKRFDGKVMAITGYEIDQVVKTPEGDKSIPIYNAYNHHYFAWLTGKDAEVYDLDKPTLLPNPTRTGVRSKPGAQQQYPTNIVFKENPGGEFRKSYHGYPKGYAQLLHSPTDWIVEPMQIDTHNRLAGNATEETGYKPWFLPKSDDMSTGFNDPNSNLSPLIECPCSDRITRSVVNSSAVLTSGTCPTLIGSETQCRAAVGELVAVSSSSTIDSATEPAGCLMKPDPSHLGTFIATFNTTARRRRPAAILCGRAHSTAAPSTAPAAAVAACPRSHSTTAPGSLRASARGTPPTPPVVAAAPTRLAEAFTAAPTTRPSGSALAAAQKPRQPASRPTRFGSSRTSSDPCKTTSPDPPLPSSTSPFQRTATLST
eukprot:m.37097 g.37097  ORF g.37097 m.37097 type:complete len:446 (-) comp11073_c0_seq2:1645-2982(-)